MANGAIRAVFVAALAVMLLAGYYSYRTFYSRYYFNLAFYGVESAAEHERLLWRSLDYDPSGGYTNLALARVLMRRVGYGRALELQQQGMMSFRPVRSFLQLASIHEKMGETGKAQDLFEAALRMNPSEIRALEHLAVIALRAGDSSRVQELTREILRLDMNNLNAHYFRAKNAEIQGRMEEAFYEYQRIASGVLRFGEAPDEAVFEMPEIEARLQALRGYAGS